MCLNTPVAVVSSTRWPAGGPAGRLAVLFEFFAMATVKSKHPFSFQWPTPGAAAVIRCTRVSVRPSERSRSTSRSLFIRSEPPLSMSHSRRGAS